MNVPSAQGILTQSSQLVSVVIPAYNAEATIDETLASVRSQTYLNLEIIVVDDGSVDKTKSIAAMHAAVDNRVKIITQENAGVAAARNTGWQAATANYIGFIDADDLWEQSKIERQMRLMLQDGDDVGLVYTWYRPIDDQSRLLPSIPQQVARGNVLDLMLVGNLVGNGSAALVRRRVLEDVGGFDSSLQSAGAHGCEDWLFYFRVATVSRFELVPDHLTGYRILEQRMSTNRSRMLRSWLLVAAEMKSRYPERSTFVERGLTYYVKFLLIDVFARLELAQVCPLISIWIAERTEGTLADTCNMLVRTFVKGLSYRFLLRRYKMDRQRLQRFPIGTLSS